MAPDHVVERVQVVLISPGDVAAERTAVADVVEEINRRLGPAQDCLLSL
jgi:hypothetical protein